VRSAGLLPGGAPASEGSRTAMRERGLDLGEHRSTRLEAALVARADLVLGMTREHVREAVVLDRDALARAFTLRELVGLAERHDPRGHDESLAPGSSASGGAAGPRTSSGSASTPSWTSPTRSGARSRGTGAPPR
jgi:protein-tyrosine-phosphatase